MLRMKRRVMRRLRSICSTNRPEGFYKPTRFYQPNLRDATNSVPKVSVRRQDSASQPFGTLVARDVPLERPSRRIFPSDKTSRREPSGRF